MLGEDRVAVLVRDDGVAFFPFHLVVGRDARFRKVAPERESGGTVGCLPWPGVLILSGARLHDGGFYGYLHIEQMSPRRKKQKAGAQPSLRARQKSIWGCD